MRPAEGLYHPRHEHASCGVAFVADIRGRRSRSIVRETLEAIRNLHHRGACVGGPGETPADIGATVGAGGRTGMCDGDETGDGAGIMLQIPDRFFRRVTDPLDFDLPPEGAYGVAQVFLPIDRGERQRCEVILERAIREAGLSVVGWRDVPHDDSAVGPTARAVMPVFRQVFVARGAEPLDADAFERRLFLARKIAVNAADRVAREGGLVQRKTFYIPSMSHRTIVYKGMLTALQLERFYPDLADPDVESAVALAHSRFSTNTFPSWELAHPYRLIAHNGEINTLRGNVAWFHAREALFRCPAFTDEEMRKILPAIRSGLSDSAILDHALEMLVMAGRTLPHAVLMMIPPAWRRDPDIPEEVRAFHQYHACLIEPWDGPALVAFCDGRIVGATLDRNGLRPGRYWITDDDRIIFASEVGVLEIPPERIVRKGRLEPGRIFLVDLEAGRIVEDSEVKGRLAAARPYGAWLRENLVSLEDMPDGDPPPPPDHATLVVRQRAFGWTEEDLSLLVAPMVRDAAEPIGSMGDDTPLAVLSREDRPLFDYFKQSFAQVTNPAIDPLREEIVMAIETTIGPEENLLDPGPEACRQIALRSPVITAEEMEKIRRLAKEDEVHFRARVLSMTYPLADGPRGLERGVRRLQAEASRAVSDGVKFLILSDRGVDAANAAIPSLLATAAVHAHLVRAGERTRVSLVVETGEAREVHHVCCLLGYGAGAVHPYLVFESIDDMLRRGVWKDLDHPTAVGRYVEATKKGILKVISKMGISTVQSYRGAQAFEAVGLDRAFVERYFAGTPSRIGGIGLEEIARRTEERHRRAFAEPPALPVGGRYHWKRGGEFHVNDPAWIQMFHRAVRTGDAGLYRAWAEKVNGEAARRALLRGLFAFKERDPVPLEEVEPVESIVRRFSTGAMSYGAISQEAHETLAIAMNRLGGRSNSGEGGEDPSRFGTERRSAVKQVASARFGVTSAYLADADELQIKIAQGAKPGEGGQLPAKKVYPWIAKVRFATPFVPLVSPPPHHDIYSIEDLAQLIYDLKNANPRARISVKLVAEVGVGTVAAGVAKARADAVLIAGHDGGTGAAPLTSIKHAGIPWEMGLAETQQTLVMNGLRDRIVVQVDGGMRTGRDVVVAALLGAEEVGFGTQALIAVGCIMRRACHLDICPVGVATQDPKLRARFPGTPEHAITYMRFVAEEVREIMARLGFRTFDEMVGRADLLDVAPAIEHHKARGIDLTEILHRPAEAERLPVRRVRAQDHGLERALDNLLVTLCRDAIEERRPVSFAHPIRNTHRSVGAMLGYHVTRRWGAAGLPDGTITIRFRGSAGQSFGAFLPRGVTLELEGDANDYVAKGLSGGTVAVFPPPASPFEAEANVVVGNVALYGATAGAIYIRGRAGERFAVRNSGAEAVVEGIGDHGCEYMTGGRVLVLGVTGRNFAAGMTGGVAYVLDEDGRFAGRVNRDLVDLEDPGADDREAIRGMLERHRAATGSAVAERCLADLDATLGRIVKVIARDYKRALAAAERDRAVTGSAV